MRRELLISLFMIFSFLLFAQVPEWQWATQAGGSDWEEGAGLAIDDNGNNYVTGNFSDTTTFGSNSLTSSGYVDIFVAKMDANGNWSWATLAGGSGYDVGCGIAIDNNENSYVTGEFQYTAIFGDHSLTSSGYSDIYVAKVDANGNWLWATQAGGNSGDIGYKIVVDNNGNSYVTGYFKDTANFGSYSLTSSGDRDIFVAKMDANGNWLWATKAGGSVMDIGSEIAIDENGNSYVTGCFSNTATFDSYSLTSSGNFDIFVAKIDTNGNWLWATKAGGSDLDVGMGIALDDNGDNYVTGYFEETATFYDYSMTSSGDRDIFVAKMDVNGNWLWVTQAGGSDNDRGRGQEIEIDDNGNSYVTGYFLGTVSFGSFNLTGDGGYVAKMDANGNWLWATKAGGSGKGQGIAIDDNRNSYVTGYFLGTATFGSYSLTSSGYTDIYVAKLGNDTLVENQIIPMKMELSNYPNPFNPTTTIEFSIQNNSKIELSIHNIKGQKIKTLVQNEVTMGTHSINWDGNNESNKPVVSGIYYYKLNVNGKTEAVKKCILLK